MDDLASFGLISRVFDQTEWQPSRDGLRRKMLNCGLSFVQRPLPENQQFPAWSRELLWLFLDLAVAG